MHFSFFRGDLPPACSLAFTTGATGGYPGSALLRIRAASDQGPGHPTVLTGSSLHGGPQCDVNSQQRTYRNLCCTVYADYVPLWHLRIVRMVLLTEPVPRSVRQV